MRKRRPEAPRFEDAYGPHPVNIGEWFVPAGTERAPTVVLIHGGFWGRQYDRHLEDHLANDLALNGYLVWNIDYRSRGEPWPSTFSDAAAAYDHLLLGKFNDRVDAERVAVVGHSAGGHLAAWLASRHRLPEGAPGHSQEAIRPALMVPQAGVVALARASEQRLGHGAVKFLVGGSPDECPDRYAVADPLALLPTGVRSVLIHAPRDRTVPLSQSRLYVQRATAAGDDSRLEISRGDHFSHLDPKSDAGRLLREALSSMTG
jgi:acetyl esterase/lipase